MAENIPPINHWYSGSPFNPNNWIVPQDSITIAYADANYLKFPISQNNPETINTLIVLNGASIDNLEVSGKIGVGVFAPVQELEVNGTISGSALLTGTVDAAASVTVGPNIDGNSSVILANSISSIKTILVTPTVTNKILTSNDVGYNKIVYTAFTALTTVLRTYVTSESLLAYGTYIISCNVAVETNALSSVWFYLYDQAGAFIPGSQIFPFYTIYTGNRAQATLSMTYTPTVSGSIILRGRCDTAGIPNIPTTNGEGGGTSYRTISMQITRLA